MKKRRKIYLKKYFDELVIREKKVGKEEAETV